MAAGTIYLNSINEYAKGVATSIPFESNFALPTGTNPFLQVSPPFGTHCLQVSGDSTNGTGYVATSTQSPEPGSGNWTIEGWINVSEDKGNCVNIFSPVCYYSDLGSNNGVYLSLVYDRLTDTISIQNKPDFYSNNNKVVISSSVLGLQLNTWYHACGERYGNTVYLYLNGNVVGSGSFTATVSGGGKPSFGKFNTAILKTSLKELRYSKIARYQGTAFTPQQSEYTSDSNTRVLLHLNRSFVDSTGNTATWASQHGNWILKSYCYLSKDYTEFVDLGYDPVRFSSYWGVINLTASDTDADTIIIKAYYTTGSYTSDVKQYYIRTSKSELTSVPTSGSSLSEKVTALFQYFFNKRTITATTMSLYKSDDATVLGTSTVSDDGTTTTKGKVI